MTGTRPDATLRSGASLRSTSGACHTFSQDIELLIDSGGGPHLILDSRDWELITNNVETLKHRSDQYPTWGGFQGVEAYKIRSLQIGPTTRANAVIWVCRPPYLERTSSIGMGSFDNSTVVIDFEKARLWIGSRAKRGERAVSEMSTLIPECPSQEAPVAIRMTKRE